MSEPPALLLLSSTGPQYSHCWTLDMFLGVLGIGSVHMRKGDKLEHFLVVAGGGQDCAAEVAS